MTTADWTAPIVPVMKRDGSIRICGDYKLTVNQVAKQTFTRCPKLMTYWPPWLVENKFLNWIWQMFTYRFPYMRRLRTLRNWLL